MMPFVILYNTLLSMGMVASMPIWVAAVAGRPKYREGLLNKLFAVVPEGEKVDAPVWYHAVSVGEVMASIPLLKRLKETMPLRPVWLSTVTSTGQKTAWNRAGEFIDQLFYFPFDMPWTMDMVIRRVSPFAFVTTETEIWPNCIWRLKRHQVPVVLVNGRISDNSYLWYRRFRFLFKRVISNFDLLCMQSHAMASRITKLGAPPQRVRVTGNIKFDMELPSGDEGEIWKKALGLSSDDQVIVAGSTHPGEEAMLLEVFLKLRQRYPKLRMVLAPRSAQRFDEVARLVSGMGISLARRSSGVACDHHVILLDTVGELSHVYAVADVALVGGSLIPRGGHNPLEAAAHGKPVVFGRYMNNFREISSLLVESGGAREVDGEHALLHALYGILGDEELRRTMGQKARETLLSHQGATEQTLQAIRGVLRDG